MDNRYFKYGCPALMQDARFITNYMDKRVFDQYIRNVNNINSAQDYKNFLQANTNTIINREQEYLLKTNTCAVHGLCVPLSNSAVNRVIANNCSSCDSGK